MNRDQEEEKRQVEAFSERGTLGLKNLSLKTQRVREQAVLGGVGVDEQKR